MQPLPPHATTADVIVGRLLQLWRAEPPIPLHSTAAEVTIHLEFDRDELESQLEFAIRKGSSGSDIEALQLRLDGIRDYLDIGKRIAAVLTDAIQAQRDNRSTGQFRIILHVEENDPYQHQEGFFTTASVHPWALDEYNIDVPEWAPVQRSPDANTVQNQNPVGTAQRYTDLEKEKHEVIIALLLESLADKLQGKHIENGQPNFTQLGELISTKCNAEGLDINGMSQEKLRKKFSDALKTKKRYIPSKK